LAVALLLVGATFAFAGNVFAGKAEHIVVVVWDGLRPDSVNETNTPNPGCFLVLAAE